MTVKVKALKVFEDIHTGEVYKVGDILEVEKARYDEIEKNLELYGGNFLEIVEEKKATKKSTKKVAKDEATEN